MTSPWLWLVWSACVADDPTTGTSPGDLDTGLPELVLPPVEGLPVQEAPPEAFVSFRNGGPVSVQDWWSDRRPEIQVLFHRYVYGWSAPDVAASAVEVHPEVEVSGGRLRQTTAASEGRRFTVALWIPDGPGPHPVVLGLNKCGNRSVSQQAEVEDGGAWTEASCDPAPGSRASYWNIDAALARGVGVATVHQSDFAPDDAQQTAPLLEAELPRAGTDDRWGAIGVWAYGLSRAVDVLRTDADVGSIVVMGHSRRGKTALWAAAQDPRIDGVWAHQSGTGGAALTRSFNGETVGAVNTLFPHWFNDTFPQFAGQETRLPLDQHLLLAMVAPRPLRVTDGAEDFWADPDGAAQSVALATPVFEALQGPSPTWSLRPGDHAVTPQDWVDMLDWLATQPL